jgi:hypothetical protein
MAPATQPAFAHLLPNRAPTTEQLGDDALLILSKLRDRLVHEDRNIPACRVDEAMEITLKALRDALGINAERRAIVEKSCG